MRDSRLAWAVYKTDILPLLTYCHIVWHFCGASDARKLERVQEKALRAVYCRKTSTYDTLQKNGQSSNVMQGETSPVSKVY